MSSTETLAHDFRPSGHQPPKQKRGYQEPDRRLCEEFERWLGLVENGRKDPLYRAAFFMTRGMEPSLGEIHSLLVKYQDRPNIDYAGLFVSALYHRIADETIIFDLDLDVPPSWLGYRLPIGKMLVACGSAHVGNGMGENAEGFTVASDNACVGNTMGRKAKAPVIACGDSRIGKRMGDESKALVVVSGKAVTGSDASWGAKAPLIVTGNARGRSFGEKSKAPVIIAGGACAKGGIGFDATSPLIAAGNAKLQSIGPSHNYSRFMDNGWGRVIVVGNAKVRDFTNPSTRIFTDPQPPMSLGEDSKELDTYIAGISKNLQGDYGQILSYLDTLGPDPGKAVWDGICDILKRTGECYCEPPFGHPRSCR